MFQLLTDYLVACCNCLNEVLHFNRVEAAFRCAETALKAFFLIDFKRLLYLARRSLCLTDAVTHCTALTFFGNNRYLFNTLIALGCADCAYGTDVRALRAFNALRIVNSVERRVVLHRAYRIKKACKSASATADAQRFVNFKCHSLTSRRRREEPYLVPVV